MILRKLTYKSKIDFGLHRGRTVEQILTKDSGDSYIKYLYFNASHIDLCDQLITDLNIFHTVSKPGKDPELFETIYRTSPLRQVYKKMKQGRDYKFHVKSTNYNIMFSKSAMKAYNEGRIVRYNK